MRLSASCSSAVGPAVRAVPAQAEVLGSCAQAVYLRTPTEVLALVTPDALRLPCAVVVASLPRAVPITVGDGRIVWPAAIATIVREWAPAAVTRVQPRPAELAVMRAAVSAVDIKLSDGLEVSSMIGRGPGLTPSGDDVLAGFLLGCRAFERDAGAVPQQVAAAAHRTTDLSAALLHHAIAGRCLPEVVAVVQALGGLHGGDLERPLAALLRVGHTSGAALGQGLLLAAALPAAVTAMRRSAVAA